MFQTTNQIYIYIYIHIIPENIGTSPRHRLSKYTQKHVCIPFSNWWFQPTPFKIMEFLRQEVGARNGHRLGGHGIPKDFADEGWPVGAHQGGIGIAPLGHVNSLARFPEAC